MKVTAEYLNFYGDHSGLAVQHAAELAGAAEIVGEYKSRGKGKGKSGTSSAHCVAMDRPRCRQGPQPREASGALPVDDFGADAHSR